MRTIKSFKYLLVLLVTVLSVSPMQAQDCNCDHQITGDNDIINVVEASSFDYQPGDTFCIQAGSYASFRFLGFVGTAEAPLIFKNCGGIVNIEGPTYSGIAFGSSRYVHLTGSGTDNEFYGIKVLSTAASTTGVSIGGLSSDFEIDHIDIGHTGFAGIMAKTDPQCDKPETWRENFTFTNLKIHHNYIHDTEGEGMYIGGTFGYESSSRKCDGIERFAHLLENVEVYNNVLVNTGWDGIQVNLAVKGTLIYNNTITGYGLGKVYAQNQGMSIGAIKGRVFNNKIIQTEGNTTDQQYAMSIINLFTDTYFYNNLIVRPGSHGIWMHQRMTDENFDINGGFYFINNTIIEPGKSGTFFNSQANDQSGPRPYLKEKYINNVVVNPGSDYTNSGFWKDDQQSYFDFNDKVDSEATELESNYTTRDMASLNFENADNNNFMILEGSPLIDAGTAVDTYGVRFDIRNANRPFNGLFDIGAYEYGATAQEGILAVLEKKPANESVKVFPNPYSKFINVQFSASGKEVSFKIYSLNGKMIRDAGIYTTYPGSVNDIILHLPAYDKPVMLVIIDKDTTTAIKLISK